MISLRIKIMLNILKDKILIILWLFFIGLVFFDSINRSSFHVNVFYFAPLAILALAYSFSFGEKIFKIIILVLFFGIAYFYFQGSLESYTCRYNSDYRCLAKKAIKSQNPSLCEKYKGRSSANKEYKTYCYIEVSKKWEDISLCDNVPKEIGHYDDLYNCVRNIAKNNNDPDLCEELKDYSFDKYGKGGNTVAEEDYKRCYEAITGNHLDIQHASVFTNDFYGMTFQVPDGYIIGSGEYGVDDPAKAEAFSFRKKSDNYSGVPILGVDDNLKLPTDQTFDQFINSIYEVNKDEGSASTDLKKSEYDGVPAYEFGINHSYTNPNGGQLLDSLGGKIVFMYKDQRVLEFLQTGYDPNLSDILKSLKFK